LLGGRGEPAGLAFRADLAARLRPILASRARQALRRGILILIEALGAIQADDRLVDFRVRANRARQTAGLALARLVVARLAVNAHACARRSGTAAGRAVETDCLTGLRGVLAGDAKCALLATLLRLIRARVAIDALGLPSLVLVSTDIALHASDSFDRPRVSTSRARHAEGRASIGLIRAHRAILALS